LTQLNFHWLVSAIAGSISKKPKAKTAQAGNIMRELAMKSRFINFYLSFSLYVYGLVIVMLSYSGLRF
jgi:hypothetical protein